MHDTLNTGLFDLAIRYRNGNPDAEWPYLAIYRIPDMGAFSDPAKRGKMGNIASTHPLLGEGKKASEIIKSDIGFLAMVQTYDPYDKKGRGKFLRAVRIVPADAVDLEKWYQEEVRWFSFPLLELSMEVLTDRFCLASGNAIQGYWLSPHNP
jgi:hypothetical protein